MAGRVPFDPFGAMLEGYRQADADNKQDLSFNAALEGAWIGNDAKRLQDLYNRDTYGPAVQMAQNQAMQSARNNAVGDATHQGNIAAGRLSSLDKTGNYETAHNNLANWLRSKDTSFKSGLSTADIQSYFAPKLAQQGGANSLYAANAFIPRDVANYDYDQRVREASLAAMLGLSPPPSGVSLGLPPTDAVANPLGLGYNNYTPPVSSASLLGGPTFLGQIPTTGGWLAPTPSAGSAQPTVTTTGSVVGGARAPTAQASKPQAPTAQTPSPQASNPQIANGPWGDAALAPTLPSNPQNVLASGLLGAYANTPNLLGTNIQAPSIWGKLLAEYLR